MTRFGSPNGVTPARRDRAKHVPSHAWRQHFLEPRLDGRLGRVGAALGEGHPAAAAVAAVAVCYVLLALTLIGSGLAVTHLVTHGRVGHWDDHVNFWFASHRTRTWNSVSGGFTLLADTIGVVAVAALATVVLLIRRWGRVALLLVIGLAIELAVFLTTTYLVGRPRPGVQHLGGTPSTFSWPSGHTAATVVLYGGIAFLVMIATPRRLPRTIAWAVTVSLVLGVALSRIYRGEHHPTDTMAGLALGIGALWAAVLTIRLSGICATCVPPSQPSPTERPEQTGRPEPLERAAATESEGTVRR